MAITILDENDKKELEQKIEDAGRSATSDAEAAAASATAAQTAQGKAETAQGEAETAATNAENSATAAAAAASTAQTLKEEVEQKLENGDYKGDDGKSAFAYAQEGGYGGSETEFANELAAIPNKVDKSYIISVFGELKTALENADIEGAIAVLDQAILDMATLA